MENGVADCKADLLRQEEEEDVEVMQVVGGGEAGGALNLRIKKMNGLSSSAGDEHELNRERPMSWEGELSDEEEMVDPPLLTSQRETASPMTLAQKEQHIVVNQDDENLMRVNNIGGAGSCSVVCGPTNLATETPNILGRFPGQSSSSPCDRHLFGDSRGSPAQSRHSLGFSGPYSQSPSPVLNRPTSSCSSRSSYSPTQSPLLGRHPAYPTATHSPVLSRHNAPTSSDGSLYSPTSSPLQGRHVSLLENNCVIYSPAQSPGQSRHQVTLENNNKKNNNNGVMSLTPIPTTGFSPVQSPAHFRATSAPGSILSRVPFVSSPSFQHRSCTTTPEQLENFLAVNSIQQPQQHQQPTQHHISAEHNNVDHKNNILIDCNRSNTVSASSASVISSASDESNASDFSSPSRRLSVDNNTCWSLGADGEPKASSSTFLELSSPLASSSSPSGGGGISRQQLLSGPCPICGDRISGFHYGIFSCESCKGFFKRTVQNKKNYVCLRGAKCNITIGTRKKCPACRFDKCLKTGMKLEAIREDRTRGGRSTYQCSYTLATQSLSETRIDSSSSSSSHQQNSIPFDALSPSSESPNKLSARISDSGINSGEDECGIVPPLMQEILAVEHLWHYTSGSLERQGQRSGGGGAMGAAALGAMGLQQGQVGEGGNSDFLSNLCNMADHRLYKIVKWCKSLPLFRDIKIDDQIALLINSWCELLLLSCCYRSMGSPQEILRISHGKSMTLEQAKSLGLGPVIERMLNLTEHMRRLQLDQYEYVCLKVIILLTSDVSGLKEPDKVGVCQKQVLEALQTYTRSHYPSRPSKFGELLLRIPELERACQIGKEALVASKQKEMPTFNLLMELLSGDH